MGYQTYFTMGSDEQPNAYEFDSLDEAGQYFRDCNILPSNCITCIYLSDTDGNMIALDNAFVDSIVSNWEHGPSSGGYITDEYRLQISNNV